MEDPTHPQSPLALRANELARAIITARLESDMNLGDMDSWQTWIDALDQVGIETWDNPLMPRLVIGALSAIAAHAIRKLAPKEANLGAVMADLAMSWERAPFGY